MKSQPRETILVLAPRGRDALVARDILHDANLHSTICRDLDELLQNLRHNADVVVVTEEAIRAGDPRELIAWIASQPPWSDLPFIVLTPRGGGLERNPVAAELTTSLGNVTFLERPFHPTTLVSIVRTAIRSRQRQYESRNLNDEQEQRVAERTAELAVANKELVDQIREREKVESTLLQMQRLEAVGQLTSGVAHDFNNLLTIVLGNLTFLKKGLIAAGVNGKLLDRLGYIRAAAERGAKLTDQMLSFSRRQRLEPRPIDLNETIVGMRALLQSTLGGTIGIETHLKRGLWSALADPVQLELAVLNLAINARDAMDVGGSVMIETGNLILESQRYPEEPVPGEYVSIKVTDSGSGMTEEVRAKAFEPFFTTKEVGKGSGLGLSQVLGFAKQSGGGVRIRSQVGAGTTAEILLPRTMANSVSRPPSPIPTERHPQGATLLLVDDDNQVREKTRAMLHELGHTVLEAGSGGAALEILERETGIDLLIVDFAMPGMNGADLARQVRLKQPALPILFATGFADRSALADIDQARILGKPFFEDELAEKIALALAGHSRAGAPKLQP